VDRSPDTTRPKGPKKRYVIIAFGALLLVGTFILGSTPAVGITPATVDFEVESLDGADNNQSHPERGQAGTPYRRVSAANYADGRNTVVDLPNARFISNRVFNDINQSIVNDQGLSQWAFAWGQFVANTISQPEVGNEQSNIAFNRNDPLESFRNSSGVTSFTRSKAAAGSGVSRPRDQVNTVSSYLDGSAIYGGTEDRLEWLRAGPVDGDFGNNSALLLLPGGQLPRQDARGDVKKAPQTRIAGRLATRPDRAVVAGSVQVNESLPLLAIQTLFAREHNRIVAKLPSSLTEEQKFQIARRVVIAEQQYVTYHDFLPALGVQLAPYRGYDPEVNATVSNEFATVGLQLDSQAAGDLHITTDASRFQTSTLAALRARGVVVKQSAKAPAGQVTLVVPANVGAFNPDLLPQLQLGPVLRALSLDPGLRNDELVDNQTRSVQFQVPSSNDPTCLEGPNLPKCFTSVGDGVAGAVQRGRDHGIAPYNDLRRAFHLAPKQSFQATTGEATAEFPDDPTLVPGQEINNPHSLDFVRPSTANGTVPSGDDESQETVRGRRTPLAARLQAIYQSMDEVDAVVGMMCEPRVPGSLFGELQLAMWKTEFTALRDGDRFFFLNDDSGLAAIKQRYGIGFQNSLADLIALNTDIPRGTLAKDVFRVPGGSPKGTGN
jgi:hypothetical protein